MALLPIILLVGITGQNSVNIDAKIAGILPTPEESRWLEIPWRLDLGSARIEAAKLKKPLFIWMMNGHPMGCT